MFCFFYKFLRGIVYLGAVFRSLFFKVFGVLKYVSLTRMDGVWLVGWICFFFTGNAAFAQ